MEGERGSGGRGGERKVGILKASFSNVCYTQGCWYLAPDLRVLAIDDGYHLVGKGRGEERTLGVVLTSGTNPRVRCGHPKDLIIHSPYQCAPHASSRHYPTIYLDSDSSTLPPYHTHLTSPEGFRVGYALPHSWHIPFSTINLPSHNRLNPSHRHACCSSTTRLPAVCVLPRPIIYQIHCFVMPVCTLYELILLMPWYWFMESFATSFSAVSPLLYSILASGTSCVSRAPPALLSPSW
ncbi:hypothetical protein BDN71DRAFT_1020299 [Pleurotus eryngii]|uniref:Uncharacterized protein n=1 Tax=Pleurotus eryngii TaxID=5323 RepID=A0A9P5ZUP0_PLEER|nr:hypothetical protein BDN71DRAFT_1020299 [Pleurotus eryngii]